MFTLHMLATIVQALDLASKSNDRALKNSKSPEFTPIYEKIGMDILTASQAAKAEITKIKQNEEQRKK